VVGHAVCEERSGAMAEEREKIYPIGTGDEERKVGYCPERVQAGSYYV